MPRAIVAPCEDFRRVSNLEVFDWTDEEQRRAAEVYTAELRRDNGKETLRPIQGAALFEAEEAGGLLAGIGVGHGKTHISFLLPTLWRAKVPLLLVPANLLDKTRRAIATGRTHWKIHPRIEIISYEKLARENSADYLTRLQPDCIIADEVHKMKNLKAAVTKRFMRYARTRSKDGHGLKFAAMSGTLMVKSLLDFWHLSGVALDEGTPLPYRLSVAEKWASAVDPDTNEWLRPDPGALDKLADKFEISKLKDPVERARDGIHKRMRTAPGVIFTRGQSCSASMFLRERKLETPPEVAEAIKEVERTWCTPNGEELEEAVDVWRIVRQLSCGYFMFWDPQAPKEWLDARKKWAKFVRQTLNASDNLDSPAQVASMHPMDARLVRWQEIRPTFEPNPVFSLIDDFVARDAAKWLKTERGIVWVESPGLGELISSISGVRYFGGGDEASAEIEAHRGPLIASIAAHGTGKNLQSHHKNLITAMPSSAAVIEQLMGRTHRQGQEQGTIVYDLYLHANALRESLASAINRAKAIQSTMGEPQKLLLADRSEGLENYGVF